MGPEGISPFSSFFSRISSLFLRESPLFLRFSSRYPRTRGKELQFTGKVGNFTPTPSAPTPSRTSRLMWVVFIIDMLFFAPNLRTPPFFQDVSDPPPTTPQTALIAGVMGPLTV